MIERSGVVSDADVDDLRDSDGRSSARLEGRHLMTYLMLTVAAVGWGVSGPTVKLTVQDLAPMTAACLRFGLGSLLLLIVLSCRSEARPLPRSGDWLLLLGLGLLGVTLFGGLYTAGLQWTGAAEGVLIQGIAPLTTILLAAPLLGEPLTLRRLIGAGVSLVGLVALVLGGPSAWGSGEAWERLFGDALMLGAAIAWGAYSVAVRSTRGRLTLAQTSAWSVFLGAGLLIPFALLETPRMPWTEVRPVTWLAIGYQLVVSSCLAYLLWNEGVRRIGAARASTFGYLGPIAGAITAWPLLGERLGPLQVLGGALILGGLFIATRQPKDSSGS